MSQIDSKILEAPIVPPTPEQRARARVYVASNATDATDARNLLDMLGLMEEDADAAA